MNTNLKSVLNEMTSLIDKSRTDPNMYMVLTTESDKLHQLIGECDSAQKFKTAYDLDNVQCVESNNQSCVFVPKNESLKPGYNKLVNDLGAQVREFYGLVQLQGTEPDARGDYNSLFINDPMSVKIIKSTDVSAVKSNDITPQDCDTQDESTDAGNIPCTHVGTVDNLVTGLELSTSMISTGTPKNKMRKRKKATKRD